MSNSRFEVFVISSSSDVPEKYKDIIIKELYLDSLKDLDDEYECISYMVIFHDGKCVDHFSDGGEPEDQILGRDLSCIPNMIQDAYNQGLKDGQSNKEKLN